MGVPSQAVTDQAKQIIDTMDAKVARANRAMLTGEGVQLVAAKAWIDARNAMADLQARYEGGRAVTTQTLQQQLFGATTVAGVDAISQRDAMDRAARLDDPAEASALLERCSWTGDDVLARAIAQHAYANAQDPFLGHGWNDVVNQYAATKPDLARRINELAAAQQTSTRDHLVAAAVFVVPRPTSLGILPDYQVAYLATQPQPDGF